MYYGARYYDAQLGRFISADTIVPDWYNPQLLNRYAYTRNNPLRYKDPSGHFLVPAAIIAVGGLVNLGVDWYITTQINHQEYSIQRGAAMFAVGAVATGVAMVGAPAAASLAVGLVRAEGTAAVVVGAIVSGATTGAVNIATGAANTAVGSLVAGMSPEETLESTMQYFTPGTVATDFGIGFGAGITGRLLEGALTPAPREIKTIKTVAPNPTVTSIPHGSVPPTLSGPAQIVANVVSDIPYLYPAFEKWWNNNPTVSSGWGWVFEY